MIVDRRQDYPDFKLDQLNNHQEGMRFYSTESGVAYPSVSTVVGYGDKFELDRWRQRVGEDEAARITRVAAQRGTMMHEAIEKILLGQQGVLEQLNMFVRPLVRGINDKFLCRITELLAIEKRLYTDRLQMAGTVDCIAKVDGELCVVDWKNSRRNKDRNEIHAYYMQCAAYAACWYERYGEPIRKLHIVMASDDNPTPIIFTEDVAKWLGPLKQKRDQFREAVGR